MIEVPREVDSEIDSKSGRFQQRLDDLGWGRGRRTYANVDIGLNLSVTPSDAPPRFRLLSTSPPWASWRFGPTA